MRLFIFYISVVFSNCLIAQTKEKFLTIKPEGHTGMIRAMVIDNEGKIITAGLDKTIKIWNSEDGYLEREILGQIGEGIEGIIYGLAISPDNKYLAVSGWFGDDPGFAGQDIKDVTDIRLYDYHTGKLIKLLKGHYDIATDMSFSLSSDQLITVDQFGVVFSWNLKENTKWKMELVGSDVNDLEILSDYFVTSHKSGLVYLWDLENPVKPIFSYKRLYKQKVPANKLAISPNGNRIAVSCGHLVIILDENLKETYSFVYGKPEHPITKMSFSDDGKRLLIAASSGYIENLFMKVYEERLDKWYVLSSYNKHRDAVLCAEFLNDSTCVTAGGLQNEIVIWRASDHKKHGAIVHKLIGYGNVPFSVGISDNKIAFGANPCNKSFGMCPFEFIFDLKDRTIQKYESADSFPHPVQNFNDYSLEISTNNSVLFIKKGNKIISSIKREITSGSSHYVVSFILDKFLVSGAAYGRLEAFDLTGKKITAMVGHEGDVIGLSVSSDGKFLVSSGRDQTIRLWRLNDIGKKDLLHPIVSLFIARNNEWVMWDEKGYFTSSKKGASYIGYHINQSRKKEAKFYSFEQFDIKYNRPDIIMANFDFIDESVIDLYHSAYLKRLKRMELQESELSGEMNVPTIEIKTVESQENKVSLAIHAYDSLYSFKSLNVYINEVPIYGENGLKIENLKLNTLEQTLELDLMFGINNIEVSITNSAGVESLKEKIVLNNKHKMESNLYIVSIGVSDYLDSSRNLEYAAKDAEDVNNLFSEADCYDNVYKKLLTNKEVTKNKLLELKNFLNNAQRNDVVLFFIAGHGVRDKHLDYFFCTYEMDFLLPSKHGISYDELELLFDGIKAIRKLLIMDTCLSGKIYKDEIEELANESSENNDTLKFRSADSTLLLQQKKSLEKTIEVVKEMFNDLTKGTGTTVISSSGGIEYALESDEWQNGLFTYCLLEGIKTKLADTDKNGIIMLSELQNYIANKVAALSNGKQIPTSRFENLNMDYRIW